MTAGSRFGSWSSSVAWAPQTTGASSHRTSTTSGIGGASGTRGSSAPSAGSTGSAGSRYYS